MDPRAVTSSGLVDSHCHLDAQYFPSGPDDVLARAEAVGVVGLVVVGVGRDLAPARSAIALARRASERVAAVVGVHPHDAAVLDDAMYADLAELARAPEVAAVGETGLDFHYDHSPRDVQRAVFARLVALARAVGKPSVVHTREAPGETLDVLEREGARDVGGIIHCFSEDVPFARRALDLGFDLSFSGIVTFKNARGVHEAAAFAPGDRIHVETDSPYLAPIPMRGKTCEPAYVVHTARRVAEIRGEAFDAFCARSRANTERRLGRAFGG
jgi:TatD DNase family protein